MPVTLKPKEPLKKKESKFRSRICMHVSPRIQISDACISDLCLLNYIRGLAVIADIQKSSNESSFLPTSAVKIPFFDFSSNRTKKSLHHACRQISMHACCSVTRGKEIEIKFAHAGKSSCPIVCCLFVCVLNNLSPKPKTQNHRMRAHKFISNSTVSILQN